MATEPIQLDDLLLVRKIANGGMAELWEGRQTGVKSFEKRLAVKLILPHLAEDDEFVRLFLDEARLAAKLNHTNICQIYKLGECNGQYYIAMDYIEGVNITSFLHRASVRQTFTPIGFVCQIMIGVCAALGYAHTLQGPDQEPLGIVHRDLSPPNIMVTQDGHVKVIDFGIAKAASHTHHTPADIMRGKFAYMSPEYVFEEQLDARSDIFSLGVVMWELVTGRRLFQADSEYGKMMKITRGNYTAPSEYRKSLSPQLEEIIMHALSFRRDDRYASCAMMQEAIEQYLLSQGQAISPRRLAAYTKWLYSNDPKPPPAPMTGPHQAITTRLATSATAQVAKLASLGLSQSPAIAVPSLGAVLPSLGIAPQELLAPSTPSQPKVLFADDHKQIRDAIRLLLSAQGYNVTTAKDGLEALEMLRLGPFDVCVLDLDMPRLNGKDTLRQLRQLCPSLPCIIQTSDNSFETATHMGRIGAFSYLTKPVQSKALLKAIEKARHHRPAGEELEQMLLSHYPTPMADLFHQYRCLPTKSSALKRRHALLASQFELYAAWLGSVKLAAYLADGAFDTATNALIRQRIGQRIRPGDWLSVIEHLGKEYTLQKRPHFSKALRELLAPKHWDNELEQTRMNALFAQLSPQLAMPIPRVIRPTDALALLTAYHSELWRNDTLLSDQDVSRNIGCIEPFLRSLYRQMYRLVDFSFIHVDAVEATQHGIHHELSQLQGLTPISTSQLLPAGLDLNGLYLFDCEHTPLFSLFPFLISGPCYAHNCGRSGISHLVQLKADLQPIYQNFGCGHLQRLDETGLERVRQLLAPLVQEPEQATPTFSEQKPL